MAFVGLLDVQLTGIAQLGVMVSHTPGGGFQAMLP